MKNAHNRDHKPEISIIIPNFNGKRYLPACLSSLQNQTLKDFEVIIIDNGSTDGSVDLLKNEYPWVSLIEFSENTGVAKACNAGIKISRGSYFITLNNDTEVMPQWIESLVKAMKKEKGIGMVSSKILLNLETREIDSVGTLMYPDGISRQRGRGEIDRGQFDSDVDTLFAHGCAAMYSMEMVKEIGLFDEDFFAYAEDTDLGLRGRLSGWKAVTAPDAVVYHKYSGTTGKYTPLKAMLVERNRILLAVKNFPISWLVFVPFFTIWRIILQFYGILTSRGSTARFKETHPLKDIIITVFNAYSSAFMHIPSMIRKRRAINRKISSREYREILGKHRISAAELILKD